MSDSRHSWTFGILAVAVSVAVLALVTGPGPAGAATAPPAAGEQTPLGRALPLPITGPSWFDASVYQRVLRAGAQGVPLTSTKAGKRGNASNGVNACAGAPGAAPTSSTVPAAASAIERPPVGIGPGTWLISLFCSNVGGVSVPDGFAWCTANFIFQSSGSLAVGTAGHCAAKDALASPVTAVVTPPPEVCANGGSCAPGLYAIGTFSTVHNNGLGDDFALVKLYPQFNSWVRPTMPVFGGPTGAYTGGLAGVAPQTLQTGPATVNAPGYYPAEVGHCGHGLVVGTGGTCRTGQGLFAASTWYAWYGPSFEGDSGSGVEILGNYSAPLNAVPAAADLTHIIISDVSINNKGHVTTGADLPGMIAGTSMTKILSIASGWQLVTGGVP